MSLIGVCTFVDPAYRDLGLDFQLTADEPVVFVVALGEFSGVRCHGFLCRP